MSPVFISFLLMVLAVTACLSRSTSVRNWQKTGEDPASVSKIWIKTKDGEAVYDDVINLPWYFLPFNGSSADEKIWQGPYEEEVIPFMVSLQFKPKDWEYFEHVCGGSLISPNHILSAGHCFYDHEKKFGNGKGQLRAVFGTTNNQEPGQAVLFELSDATVNPGYQNSSGIYSYLSDNSVITLPESVSIGDSVGTVCLASEDIDSAESYKLVGWGNFNCFAFDHKLRFAYGQLIANDDCEAMWKERNPGHGISPGQLCMLFIQPNGDLLSTGIGDSGGPVYVSKDSQIVQIGIVSFSDSYKDEHGNMCPIRDVPQVFSRVSYHWEFILENAPGARFC